MKNHGRKPNAIQAGWKAAGMRSLPVLTHRYQNRTRSWWLDVDRDQWSQVIEAETTAMNRGRYGLLSVPEREWE